MIFENPCKKNQHTPPEGFCGSDRVEFKSSSPYCVAPIVKSLGPSRLDFCYSCINSSIDITVQRYTTTIKNKTVLCTMMILEKSQLNFH